MKQVIDVFDKMEITTVKEVEEGIDFYFPVTSETKEANVYRVLYTGGRGGNFSTPIKKHYITIACDSECARLHIVCLDILGENVVQYFLPDDKCMIGV